MDKSYSLLQHSQFIIGRGSISFLNQLKKKRAAVVFDGNIIGETWQRRITELISEGGGECRFIADIRHEPYFKDIMRTAVELSDYQPDLIIAVGGGSVIDTAKALWLFYEHPELTFEDAFIPYGLPESTGSAQVVAIPTTSGTGSETTSAAVFINQDTNIKNLMLGNSLIPTYAILDADFTDTLPDIIAAYTGLDALTHAMEAAVCKISSPMVTSVAATAALDILENLHFSTGKNVSFSDKRKAREICHNAASLAGLAITNSCAGLAHGLDQPGPYFNLPHGLVCGVLLPHTTAFHSPHTEYVKLSKRLGYSGSDKELCQQLVDHLWDFIGYLGVEQSFSGLGIDEKAYFNNMESFIESCNNAVATKLSPRIPDFQEAERLFSDSYYGEKPVVR
jgi:alcohol dehydrogenase class IV